MAKAVFYSDLSDDLNIADFFENIKQYLQKIMILC
jgi:hypothetical protein